MTVHRCGACGEPGHNRRTCPVLNGTASGLGRPRGASAQIAAIVGEPAPEFVAMFGRRCRRCGERGHRAADCPSSSSESVAMTPSPVPCEPDCDVVLPHEHPPPTPAEERAGVVRTSYLPPPDRPCVWCAAAQRGCPLHGQARAGLSDEEIAVVLADARRAAELLGDWMTSTLEGAVEELLAHIARDDAEEVAEIDRLRVRAETAESVVATLREQLGDIERALGSALVQADGSIVKAIALLRAPPAPPAKLSGVAQVRQVASGLVGEPELVDRASGRRTVHQLPPTPPALVALAEEVPEAPASAWDPEPSAAEGAPASGPRTPDEQPATAGVAEQPAVPDDGLSRDQRRSRRKREVRPKTLNLARIPRSEVRRRRAEQPDADRRHLPMVRGECASGPRPCPYVSCAYHLFLDVTRGGGIKFNFPDLLGPDETPDLELMTDTCVLDVADQGEATLERVGAAFNVTRERVRQLEVKAMARIQRKQRELREFVSDGPRAPRPIKAAAIEDDDDELDEPAA